MACQNCTPKTENDTTEAQCSVCVEVNNDTSVKNVFWCEVCKAYICTVHQTDYVARMAAAIKVKAKKVINFTKK